MQRLALGLLSTLLVLAGCAAQQRPPQKRILVTGAYEVYPSGMRLLVQEIPQAPQVALLVSYRAGAADEPAGKEGLALLASRLTFVARQGTGPVPRLDSQLLAAGAVFTAEVGSDDTDYEAMAPADRLARLAVLEAQRMRDPLAGITEADFVQVREGLAEQLRSLHARVPFMLEQHLVREALLPGHPYGRLFGGTPASVRSVTLEDVRAFVKTYYTPAHAVLVVTGPMSAAEAKFEVARAFTGLTGAGGATRTAPVSQVLPPLPQPLTEHVGVPHLRRSGPVDAPQLWLVWKVPGMSSGMQLQARLIARYLEPELKAALKGDSRVMGISATFREHSGVTLLTARLSLEKAEDAEAVAKKALDYLADVRKSSWASGGLSGSLKADAILELYRELERSPGRGMAHVLRTTGQPTYLAWRQQQLQSGVDQLEAFVREHLLGGAVWSMLVVPDGRTAGAVHLLPSDAADAMAVLSPLHDWEVPVPPGMDVRRTLQAPGLADAERLTLSNGLKVVVRRRGDIPIVDARMLLPGQPLGTLDSTSLLHRGLIQGTWTSDIFGYTNGMALEAEEGHDVLGVTASSLAFSDVLGTLSSQLRELDPKWLYDLERNRWKMVKEFQEQARREETGKEPWRKELQVKATVRRALVTRLLPGVFLGSLTEKDVAELSSDAVAEWYATWVRPGSMTLVLVGDVPPREQLAELLEARLGQWKPDPGPAPKRAEVPRLPGARSVVVVDAPDRTDAVVDLGLRGPVPDGREEAAMDVLVSVLEKRLRRQFSGVKGAPPSVMTRYEQAPEVGILHMKAVANAETVSGVLDQLLGELGAMEDAPPSGDEVERVRWQVARRQAWSFKTSEQVAHRLALLQMRGRAPDHWDRYPEHLAAVTPASLQALVGRLSLGSEVVVITGNASLLKPQLQKAGYQVEVVSVPKKP